jgi:signal recognition particle subunit SRP54
MKSLSPGQAFLRIVQLELERAMGTANETLDLATQPPAVILMAGLQGSGKTTSAAKLARWLKEKGKKVLMVSADVYRPAAIRQLETLAESVGVGFVPSHEGQRPLDIAQGALQTARIQFADVLIVDTAGRLAIDAAMMQEIRELHAA